MKLNSGSWARATVEGASRSVWIRCSNSTTATPTEKRSVVLEWHRCLKKAAAIMTQCWRLRGHDLQTSCRVSCAAS